MGPLRAARYALPPRAPVPFRLRDGGAAPRTVVGRWLVAFFPPFSLLLFFYKTPGASSPQPAAGYPLSARGLFFFFFFLFGFLFLSFFLLSFLSSFLFLFFSFFLSVFFFSSKNFAAKQTPRRGRGRAALPAGAARGRDQHCPLRSARPLRSALSIYLI